MKQLYRYVEELNIDTERITQDNLVELAELIEHCIRNELMKILNQRLINLVVTIGTEIADKVINISVDLEVEAYIPPHTNLESILDRVLNYAFTKVRTYLSRFRKYKENDNK
ncbi:MAG: hypothetical protein QW101_01470 [Ignisphaera sp.]|uniref:DUF3194 domain-containing protein n=1 Tax=Ignisphaera aggregans TaxID=334771 RepID=A0A7J3MZF5_9CREN